MIAIKYNPFKALTNRIDNLFWLIRIVWVARRMRDLPTEQFGEYTFSGLECKQIAELEKLHQLIRPGKVLGFWKKSLLKYRGKFLCSVATDNTGRLIGFQSHTFKHKELTQGIIHLEYSTLLPEVRGKGLSSSLRRHTARHYASQGLTGLTAITSSKNIPDLTAAEHIGYQVINKPTGSKGFVQLYLDFSAFKIDQ